MKARHRFSDSGNAAAKKEINRQIVEQKEKFMKGVDAQILWTAHTLLGFGKKRLERLYRAIIRDYIEACEFFETTDTFPAELKLEKLGVNLEELRKEQQLWQKK